METTPETETTGAKRICRRPGCEKELGPKNRVGLCQRHVNWTETREQSTTAGNGHTSAAPIGNQGAGEEAATKGRNGSNRHALEATQDAPAPKNGSNGARKNAAVLPDLAADRVDQLLATLTAGDKARLALAWLRGEL